MQLTLKRQGGEGWISPKDFWTLARLYKMELWLSNLHLIIIFVVYIKWKKIILGVVFKIFLKIWVWKHFFFVKSESKILETLFFTKSYKPNCTFYYKILIWNYFSFHLMYILSILVKNYRFSKIESWKIHALRWGYFGATLWKYSESQNGFQRFYRRMNMPNVIWDHFWWIWV